MRLGLRLCFSPVSKARLMLQIHSANDIYLYIFVTLCDVRQELQQQYEHAAEIKLHLDRISSRRAPAVFIKVPPPLGI